MKNTGTAYTADQVRDAERMAEILAKPAKEQREILAMLGNAFIEGLVAGSQLGQMADKTTATQ